MFAITRYIRLFDDDQLSLEVFDRWRKMMGPPGGPSRADEAEQRGCAEQARTRTTRHHGREPVIRAAKPSLSLCSSPQFLSCSDQWLISDSSVVVRR